MSKKLLAGFAPVFAAAAFAAVPTVLQAAPHVYKNGVIGAEGKKVRTITWGNTLKFINASLGELECHNLFAGYLENPTGGGAAVGKVQAFAPYECVSASCIALGGKAVDLKQGKMPWVAEVIEPKAGTFREKLGFKGTEKNKKPPGEGFVDLNYNCEGVYTPEFFGEAVPLIQNNGLSAASPGELELQPTKVDPESPNLESELFGAIELEGKVKVEGYGGQELIEVKNP